MAPDAYTNQELMLDVGNGHQLYLQDWGNAHAGKTIIFFHGGPGSRVKNEYRDFFDPGQHHVIFYDQRGCGRSTPYGSLEHNTTDDLIADINKIADHFKLETFIVFGASWGSCLPLAYAIRNPQRVASMILRGIFTGSQAESDWLDKGLFRAHYPEVWEQFLDRTPQEHHDNPANWHYQQVLHSDDEQQMRSSALAIEEMESRLMTLNDQHQPIDPETFDPTSARIFSHYAGNDWWMPKDYILQNAHTLTMPVTLVHGRYDMDCPPVTAYKLNKQLPNSALIWTISGHRSDHESDAVLRALLLRV